MMLLSNSKRSIVGLEGYGLKIVGQKPVPGRRRQSLTMSMDALSACRHGRKIPTARPAVDGVKGARILIVESRYYPDIADALISGAEPRSRGTAPSLERVVVPGAFEIPGRHRAGRRTRYDGFVALGCVIRGETTHYDYVCGESARGLMDLSVQQEAGHRLRHRHREHHGTGQGARRDAIAATRAAMRPMPASPWWRCSRRWRKS